MQIEVRDLNQYRWFVNELNDPKYTINGGDKTMSETAFIAVVSFLGALVIFLIKRSMLPATENPLWLFNRARDLCDAYRKKYAATASFLPYHTRRSPDQIEALRNNRDLLEAETLFVRAFEIEQRLFILSGKVDLDHLANAINAALEVSLLYREREDFNSSRRYATIALQLLGGLPQKFLNRPQIAGMQGEALFRMVEMDHFLGSRPKDELVRRYEKVLALDELSDDQSAKRITQTLIGELKA